MSKKWQNIEHQGPREVILSTTNVQLISIWTEKESLHSFLFFFILGSRQHVYKSRVKNK